MPTGRHTSVRRRSTRAGSQRMEAFATLRILPVPTRATSAVSYAHSLRRFGYHGPWPLASRSAALRISTTSSQAVLLVSKVHSLGGIDGRSSSALSYVHRSTLGRFDRSRSGSATTRERHLVGREEQDSAGRDSVGHASKQCLIFATLEERAMRDDIESPASHSPTRLPYTACACWNCSCERSAKPPIVSTRSSRSSTATFRPALRSRLPNAPATVLLPEAIGPTITTSSPTSPLWPLGPPTCRDRLQSQAVIESRDRVLGMVIASRGFVEGVR